MNRILICLTLLGFSNFLYGQQTPDLGNWIMYFGQNRVSDQWSIHSEVQYRNHSVSPTNIEQLLLRTGLNYHTPGGALLTAGYGYIASYDYKSEQSEPESKEHRIWQQLILINKLSRLKFEHRYRIEQRWVNKDYRNRLRYRLMVFVPLNKPVIETGTVFLGLYDEVFLNTTGNIFDRNRLYAALGYQFSKSVQAQVGLLNQYVGDNGKYYLQFGVVFNRISDQLLKIKRAI